MRTGIAKVAGVRRSPEKRAELPTGADRAAAVVYIASMSADLAAIARRHEIRELAYLLDMARLEAETTAQNLGS